MSKIIRIEVYDKHTFANRWCTEFELDGPYLQGLAPLNRNREIPFDLPAQQDARVAQQLRLDAAKIVAERFLTLLEKQDPQMGYPPQ